LFLFVFADRQIDLTDVGNIHAQKGLLRKRFGKSGWECPQILDALDAASEIYFDRVSQIYMGNQTGSWTRGRVALTGDSAFCVSLLGGQGSALAMIAAYILAGELHHAGNAVGTALARYQQQFQPFILKKQSTAPRFAGFFAPKSASSMFIRNQILNLMKIPFVPSLAAGRDLADNFVLPEY
jgi:2-polyprenyl-6-methoxyphenol hydroxylase-like FAD-dependent oxidoreductase